MKPFNKWEYAPMGNVKKKPYIAMTHVVVCFRNLLGIDENDASNGHRNNPRYNFITLEITAGLFSWSVSDFAVPLPRNQMIKSGCGAFLYMENRYHFLVQNLADGRSPNLIIHIKNG